MFTFGVPRFNQLHATLLQNTTSVFCFESTSLDVLCNCWQLMRHELWKTPVSTGIKEYQNSRAKRQNLPANQRRRS